MDTEKIGISSLTLLLARVEGIKTFFNDNDKTPIWDGSINVYTDIRCTKDSLKMEIPVQIKGREVKKLSGNSIYYPVEISDLKGFKSKNGSIFFVVDFNNDKQKIYYNSLLPYKINDILNSTSEKQKTKTIKFTKFPTEKEEIKSILLNYILHSQQQKNFTFVGYKSDKDLIKEGFFKCYEISCIPSEKRKDDPIKYLLENETYLYAVDKMGTKYPLELINNIQKTISTVHRQVVCGNVSYPSYQVIRNKKSGIIKIGRSFTLNILSNPISIQFKLDGELSDRIKDIDCLLELQNNDIYIDKNFICRYNASFQANFSLENISLHKKFLENIRDVLSLLHIPENKISYNDLSKNDFYLAKSLIALFDKHQSIPLKNIDITEDIIPQMFRFANICIPVLLKHDKDKNFFVYDLMSHSREITATTVDNKTFPISRFMILQSPQLLKMSNFDAEYICDDIQSYQYDDDGAAYVTKFGLELLFAYDESRDKKYLNCAERLFTWIISKNLNNKINDRLNMIQCHMRNNNVSDIDKEYLLTLLTENCNSEQKLACYILLNMKEGAQKLYNQLSIDEQEYFISYPIGYLYKQLIS